MAIAQDLFKQTIDVEAKSASNPVLSIVVPVFNEKENLLELTSRLRTVLSPLDLDWELILIDDGSADGSWTQIAELHALHPNLKGIRLSRNFGHQYALFAGLQHARGAAVISMDGDMQHPPEVLPRLLEEWKRGSKIVNTIRADPPNISLFKRLSARCFYRFFSLMSGVNLEHGMADFRLLDRAVVNELLRFREEGLFLRGIVQWVGYATSTVHFDCAERFAGQSKYNFRKMITLAWHGISSFSVVPLRIAIGIGLLTSALSFYWLAEAIFVKMFTGKAVPGWASTVGILSLLFGIQFIFLGVIGEYIGRILTQVRQRPLFLVSDRVGMPERSQPPDGL
jgi:polyisoprenyl-phosphate glycosyltransferase